MPSHADIFWTSLASQFQQIFQLSQQGADNSIARLRAQGFIHAGELLGLCQREQVQQLMEQQHFQVFGCSIAQRNKTEAQRRQQALACQDYQYFDEPALLRQQR